MSGRVFRKLATNPTAMLRFRATGRLPREVRIQQTPLLVALEKLGPRIRQHLRGFAIDAQLGYRGRRQFHTADQAYRWLGGYNRIRLDCEPRNAAESWIDPGFRGPVSWPEIRSHVYGDVPPQLETMAKRLLPG